MSPRRKRPIYVGLGECAFCGHPDAGHRVWDAIAERLRAGEPIEDVAADWDLTARQAETLARRSLADDHLTAFGRELLSFVERLVTDPERGCDEKSMVEAEALYLKATGVEMPERVS